MAVSRTFSDPGRAAIELGDGDVLGKWREANRNAAEAERILLDGQMLFVWGLGEAPGAEERCAATQLRLIERQLFRAASALFTSPASRPAKVPS